MSEASLSVTEAQLSAIDKQRQGRTGNPFFSSERNNSPTQAQGQAKKDNTNVRYKPKLPISILSCCSFQEMQWAVTDLLHRPLDPQPTTIMAQFSVDIILVILQQTHHEFYTMQNSSSAFRLT